MLLGVSGQRAAIKVTGGKAAVSGFKSGHFRRQFHRSSYSRGNSFRFVAKSAARRVITCLPKEPPCGGLSRCRNLLLTQFSPQGPNQIDWASHATKRGCQLIEHTMALSRCSDAAASQSVKCEFTTPTIIPCIRQSWRNSLTSNHL